jgi:hypothetical protein
VRRRGTDNGLGYQGKKLPVSVEARSRRITVLLPMVSSMRHSKNSAAIACATALQEAVRDLERLNDVEICCSRYNDEPLRPLQGLTEEFFNRLNEILSKV